MADIDSLIQQLDQSGKDVFWQGKASQASIEKLEALLAGCPDIFFGLVFVCGMSYQGFG